MTTHPPAQMPTERGTAVENESDRGACADCGGAGVIEVESVDEHRDFQPCRCATGPTAGERVCRYPCGCDQFADEHCACMDGHTPTEPVAGDVEARDVAGLARASQQAMQTKLDRLHEDVANARAARDAWQAAAAKASAHTEDAEAAYRAMYRQFEAIRDDRDRLRAGVEALADEYAKSPALVHRTGVSANLQALLADRSTR